jgi:uncharacterized membrane protein (GlpM family)
MNAMQFLLKLLITNLVIIGCAQVGRRFPSLGGLIATMPLTTLAVLLWLHTDNPGDRQLLTDYTRGVLWGIGPTSLFFAAAWFCLRRGLSLPVTLAAGFGAWLVGALCHQTLLR